MKVRVEKDSQSIFYFVLQGKGLKYYNRFQILEKKVCKTKVINQKKKVSKTLHLRKESCEEKGYREKSTAVAVAIFHFNSFSAFQALHLNSKVKSASCNSKVKVEAALD